MTSLPHHNTSFRRGSSMSPDLGASDLQSVTPPPHEQEFIPISSSLTTGNRDPIRSFIHGSMRERLAPLDSTVHARSVRDDTAELASYVLSDPKDTQTRAVLSRKRAGSTSSQTHQARIPVGRPNARLHEYADSDVIIDSAQGHWLPSSWVGSPSRPSSVFNRSLSPAPGQSTNVPSLEIMVEEEEFSDSDATSGPPPPPPDEELESGLLYERTPLLASSGVHYGVAGGPSRGGSVRGRRLDKRPGGWVRSVIDIVSRKKNGSGRASKPSGSAAWDKQSLCKSCVVTSLTVLPAVVVGLLLNILDALSYGMILFPLGDPLFSHLGPPGISIFYVSTIISQLTFSTGSIFKCAIGSELIEVVPFFHAMAGTITTLVGRENPDAVIATTIVSYAFSSMLTGLVFFCMGQFKLGSLVGFIPRHILIGCIGGVGWFLVITGFEVTARLGSFHYDLNTIQKLMAPEAIPLWVVPLLLALILFYSHSRIQSKYFLPLFILSIPLVFYASLLATGNLDPENLRANGWVFYGPPSDEPWWYFYTLYKFGLVRWDAIIECIPAMFALTFFGILHVPINVPALALQTGEDHADLNHELKLHGCSNFLSGAAGSIQNYLVYANTVFFVRSGGDTRLAGYGLAVLTFLVMMVGPYVIGFIPIMMVGTLIFDLGFELLLEAVWLPRKKLRTLEYVTVLIIVFVMGVYDFVIGIGVGVVLALATLVFQTSRVSAVRNSFTGDLVGSTVRRNPAQHQYLKQVGQQVFVMKLSGYLFFGTIVGVESKIRSIISDEAFTRRPYKFIILDLWNVTGVDYSAGEAFNTISRLLQRKQITLTISGVDPDKGIGRTLRTMGVGETGEDVVMLPTLNLALESCENELLKTFYVRQVAAQASKPSTSLDIPPPPRPSPADYFSPGIENSPRATERIAAATCAMEEHETVQLMTKWQHFSEPLRLMLQIFQETSGKDEYFWNKAVNYFESRHFSPGEAIFRAGQEADGFWLLERGLLRAEYDLPQGFLCESIVAGTTFGELTFFSHGAGGEVAEALEGCEDATIPVGKGKTKRRGNRTVTVVAERESVAWVLASAQWVRLQQHHPDVAKELLRIGLKTMSERMEMMTTYTLAMAG